MDVATLAELLRETEERHGHYEKTHAKHYWWDWYAPYLSARQQGSSPDEATAAADRRMDEVFHYAGGPFNNAVENPRVGGRDPEGRSYFSFASFEDPDGNGWLLQEITTRLPGREWETTQARTTDVATLAELLRETAEHHDRFEKTHGEHRWSDWYASYLSARQNGDSPDEAAAAADRRMEEALQVVPG